jgi:hypothetical protein
MSTRWQHKVVEIPIKMFGGKTLQHAQEELDKLGAQGWELVTVLQHSSMEPIRMYLKRPA